MHEVITNNLDLWISALVTKSTTNRNGNGNQEAYGIKKLRELILELAVGGKLVPQEGEWSQLSLSDLGEWAVGSGFPKSEQGKEGLEILFAKVSDMNLPENTRLIVTTNHTISKETATKLGVNVHAAGTVIFPKIGGAIATNKRRILSCPTAIDNNCLGISPKTAVSTDWLYLLLSSIDFTKYQAGTSVPALSQGVLEKIPVSLPPPAEQRRIVAKVDELMALCDQLEQQQTHSIEAHQTLVETVLGTLTRVESQQELSEAWTRIANHFDTLFATEHSIDQLKQTILQLAVMGKLVPQYASDEPASVLLGKIAQQKERLIREGKIKKQGPLPEISDDEKPFKLPSGWTWARLQDVIDVRDGTHDSPKDAYGPNIHPLVTSKDFDNGEIDFAGARRISAEDHFEISKRSLVEKYDILFSMIGGNLGNQVLVKDDSQFSVKNVALFKYYSKALTSPFFIKKYMEHLALDLQEKAIGGAQPFVSLGFLRNLVFALPPIEEQHRIVAKVDELMALCAALEARIVDAQTTQVHLADAIVEQAVA